MTPDSSTMEGVGAGSILVVDDDEALCGALSRALGRRGFRAWVAHSAEAAIRAAREQRLIQGCGIANEKERQLGARGEATNPSPRIPFD